MSVYARVDEPRLPGSSAEVLQAHGAEAQGVAHQRGHREVDDPKATGNAGGIRLEPIPRGWHPGARQPPARSARSTAPGSHPGTRAC